MNIPRGFRRLSVLVGLVGLTITLMITWGSYGLPLKTWITTFGILVVAPVLFVLLLGWVVEGFKKSN